MSAPDPDDLDSIDYSVCGAPGCGQAIVDDGTLRKQKTKCKNCKVALHTADSCSKVWMPFTYSTFCTVDCIKAYNVTNGKNYPLAQHPPGSDGSRGQAAADTSTNAGRSTASSEVDAGGAAPSAGARKAPELWICGACKTGPASPLHHICKSCGEHVHSFIICDMVGCLNTALTSARRHACAPSIRRLRNGLL